MIFIKEFILKNQFKIIAEVGVHGGNHATQIMEMCNDYIQKFFLIDPYLTYKELDQTDSQDRKLAGYDQLFWNNVMFKAYRLALTNSKFFLMRMTSLEASIFFVNTEFDLVFIDADHSYKSVIRDLAAWIPLIKNGGFIAGHDYEKPGNRSGWIEVVEAVDNIIGKPEYLFKSNSWATQINESNRKEFLKNVAKYL